MNYRLNEVDGKVRYMVRTNGGFVGSSTRADTAHWMMAQGKAEKSDEVAGFPVKVAVNGTVYHFEGEWLMGGEKDILSDEPKNEPVKRRRAKK